MHLHLQNNIKAAYCILFLACSKPYTPNFKANLHKIKERENRRQYKTITAYFFDLLKKTMRPQIGRVEEIHSTRARKILEVNNSFTKVV